MRNSWKQLGSKHKLMPLSCVAGALLLAGCGSNIWYYDVTATKIEEVP